MGGSHRSPGNGSRKRRHSGKAQRPGLLLELSTHHLGLCILITKTRGRVAEGATTR